MNADKKFMKSKKHYNSILTSIESEGLYKKERVITSPQRANIEVKNGLKVLNMCANNYLGLANNPEIIEAAPCHADLYSSRQRI